MQYFKNIKQSFKLKNNINYFVLMALLVVLIITDQFGLLGRSMTGLITKMGYSAILAVSLNLVVGFLGELSLGHAGFMCAGAYIGCFFANYMYTVVDNQILVLFLAMIVGGLVATILGFIVGLPALRLKGDYLAIVTLAFGEIIRNIFNNTSSDTFGGAMGMSTKKLNGTTLFIITLITLIIVLFLCQSLIRSKHGRAITAIRDNEIAAKSMGINVTYYKLFVFALAACFAGIAGVLYGHSLSTVRQDAFTYNYSIEILVMVVLGGIGSMRGSIISASLIVYINALLQNNLSGDMAEIKQAVYAVILIIVVIFNNAPALNKVKDKLSLSNIFKKSKKPEVIHDDGADWRKVPTKIPMDEVLTADLPNNEAFEPDKPEKGDK
ncbi:MAG: branched-chain amino acid ABC transporter permease [Acutalibacteraceae bacterium]